MKFEVGEVCYYFDEEFIRCAEVEIVCEGEFSPGFNVAEVCDYTIAVRQCGASHNGALNPFGYYSADKTRLRKKPKPGDQTFKDLMNSLKTGEYA